MGTRIDPEQLRSVKAVEAFLERGRFHYALEAVRSTRVSRAASWHEWVTLPVTDRTLDRQVFMEAVESLGLARMLEKRSAADALRWLAGQDEPVHLGITVSGASLADPELTSRLLGQIEDAGVEPRRIGFGLAVHSALADLGGATRFVKAMRRIGCLVTLSNGIPGNPVLGLYGPLGYVNHLRVDRQWVTAAPHSVSHRQTLESIVDYAKRLRLEVIADGVDRPEQLEIVTALGIDFYQGALHGKPQLVAESRSADEPLLPLAAGFSRS